MTILEKLTLSAVPDSEQPIVDLFRDQLGDLEELNTLEEVKENTDLELYRALYLTLSQLNALMVSSPNYTELKEIPEPGVLFLGATLKILTKKGIISARNTLTYSDPGGVTVQDYDKYGRYINYFNVLITSYYNSVKSIDIQNNINDCYGGIPSEYSQSSRFTW